jgi:5-methylthioadenosine/S-adenosylhomocysteine deaminase
VSRRRPCIYARLLLVPTACCGCRLDSHRGWDVANPANIAQLQKLQILGPNVQLVHMGHVEAAEVPALARTGTHCIHCPAASMRVGMGVSTTGKFPEMMRAGVNCGLGSDSGNYSDFFDIGRQMYLAATLHREVRRTMPPATLSAADALEMATINGARALGVAAHVGSLEVGKRADLVIHRFDRPELRCAHGVLLPFVRPF